MITKIVSTAFRRNRRPLAALGVLAAATLAVQAATPDKEHLSPAAQQQAAVVAHLTAALNWYHQAEVADGWIVQAGDEYYKDSQRELTRKVVVSAFDYARAMVAVIDVDGQPAGKPPAGDPRQARLATRLALNTEQLVRLRDQQADLKARIATAAPADQPALQAQDRVVQAEVDLDLALADTLQKAATLFSNASEATDGATLESHVSALQHTVPEVFDGPATAPPKSKAAPAPTAAGGLLNRVSALFSFISRQRAMDALLARTAELRSAANGLAEPIGAELKTAMQAGDEAAKEAAPGGDADLAKLDQSRQRIETLTARFRNLSGALIPLREEVIALDQCRTNLDDWKRSATSQTDGIVRYLFVHAIALALAFAVLLTISEVWRRATFKYIREPRRRRQFLLIRRFVTTILMVLVIVTGFVSDFSSIATFAGFITAGVAVALQTVILSVAAYFFLIGRYGVKVGDRVTVAGVTGDVIDVGLVRVFLMELAGTGVDLHPTGRVIVLANSALFSNAPVYKQLPGTDYAWHELFVVMAGDADTAQGEAFLLDAVTGVYDGYRDSIERQHGALQRLVDYKTDLPVPSAHVRLTDSALEIVVRYPAEIRRMAEIDELVTRAVLAALRSHEEIRKAFATMPRIRAAVKS